MISTEVDDWRSVAAQSHQRPSTRTVFQLRKVLVDRLWRDAEEAGRFTSVPAGRFHRSQYHLLARTCEKAFDGNLRSAPEACSADHLSPPAPSGSGHRHR